MTDIKQVVRTALDVANQTHIPHSAAAMFALSTETLSAGPPTQQRVPWVLALMKGGSPPPVGRDLSCDEPEEFTPSALL